MVLTCATTCDGGCGSKSAGGRGGDYCTTCDSPDTAGTLKNGALDEASGVAASRSHPDVFYAHNDSGGGARLFVMDGRGNDLGVVAVTGAAAVDWEDVAVGPCDAGSCVYIGDIGDNDVERSVYDLYRLPEPNPPGGEKQLRAERFSFTYPDGPHNAETLLVHPTSGAVYVVTKVRRGAASVFAFPLPLASGAVLTHLGEITPPHGKAALTGGDIHPHGKGVLLRSKNRLFYYGLTGEDVAGALRAPPCVLPLAIEDQGEAVCWLASGRGYLTVSEGAGSRVSVSTCL